MTNPAAVRDADLHAYVDGVLDDEGRSRVEAWLAAHPEDEQRVAAYTDQNLALHALYDSILDEPAPLEMTETVTEQEQFRLYEKWRRIAAGVVLLAVGGVAGWMLHDWFPGGEINVAQTAINAHTMYVAEKRHAVEVAANEEKHLVKWLSKRLGQPIKAPDLLAKGYRLVGGRLLPDEGRPAAQFMYENDAGARLTIYVRRSGGGQEMEFQFASHKGVSAFYWVDEDFAYALAGDLRREGLLEVAKIIHRELTP